MNSVTEHDVSITTRDDSRGRNHELRKGRGKGRRQGRTRRASFMMEMAVFAASSELDSK